MATTQSNRKVQITTPLGKDALIVSRFSAVEQMSSLFQFDIALISEKGDLPVDDKRYFHGFVTEFSQVDYDRRFHHYQATVRPWLWFLTRSADCRIFQKKSVTEIFEEVVK